MNLKFSSSVKVKNKRSMNLETKSLLYVLPPVSYLVFVLSAMNIMDTQLIRVWNRCEGLPEKVSTD